MKLKILILFIGLLIGFFISREIYKKKPYKPTESEQVTAPIKGSSTQSPQRTNSIGLLQQLCDNGNDSACYRLVNKYQDTGGHDRTVHIMQKVCDRNNLNACYLLGGIYASGYGVIKVDSKKALTLFQKACNGGIKEACEEFNRKAKNININKRLIPHFENGKPTGFVEVNASKKNELKNNSSHLINIKKIDSE